MPTTGTAARRDTADERSAAERATARDRCTPAVPTAVVAVRGPGSADTTGDAAAPVELRSCGATGARRTGSRAALSDGVLGLLVGSSSADDPARTTTVPADAPGLDVLFRE